MIRKDWNDQIFRTEAEKNNAIVSKILETNQKGQPILIFTSSINKSETYSKLLNSRGIKHSVLNAKHHEKEANIIADAGKAKNSKIYNVLDPKLQDFEKALHRLTLNLSKQIVVDGEGAKKFITIKIIGARSTTMAKNIGFSIANSPLFKTAVAGEDPNWGRIIMGIGKSGENITPNKVQIKIGDYIVAEQSKIAKDYKEKDVKEYMKWDSINIEINLNIGNASHTVYTCDFTHEYIDINTDYRN